jgi:hypothetical protein
VQRTRGGEKKLGRTPAHKPREIYNGKWRRSGDWGSDGESTTGPARRPVSSVSARWLREMGVVSRLLRPGGSMEGEERGMGKGRGVMAMERAEFPQEEWYK